MKNEPTQADIKKMIRLFFVLVILLSLNIIFLSYKFKRDLQSQKSAKEDRAELIELNKKQLEILENIK